MRRETDGAGAVEAELRVSEHESIVQHVDVLRKQEQSYPYFKFLRPRLIACAWPQTTCACLCMAIQECMYLCVTSSRN